MYQYEVQQKEKNYISNHQKNEIKLIVQTDDHL